MSGSFKKAGSKVFLVSVPYSAELVPDFEVFKKNTAALYKFNSQKKINAMYPVCAGGIAEGLSKMSLGNKIGVSLDTIPLSCTAASGIKEADVSDLFTPLYGSILVESDFDLDLEKDFIEGTVSKIGETICEPSIELEDVKISLDEIESAWESKLEKVFPPVSGAELQPPLPSFALKEHESLEEARKKSSTFDYSAGKTKPKVVIPVFPGTNCEYDMARAFNLNGGETKIVVFRNRTPKDLAESLDLFKAEIDEAQILAFAGGFSAGDEPDGSGKYIANVIREHRIADSIMELLKKRDGLVLGICNGFQALIKTGLVPYGEIKEPSADMPTLTYNRIGRHISRVVRTRMVSAKSPWAQDSSILNSKIHLIPVSHGEGRIVITEELAEKLFANGQVFTQYVDENGIPSIIEPDNPNGSLFAIEGLTSPDGRVLGKMGHNERTMGTDKGGSSIDLIKNIAGMDSNESSCQNIFAAGIRYFN